MNRNTLDSWIALYVNCDSATYFNSVSVQHIPEDIKNFIGNKSHIKNIFRLQAYDSIMCVYCDIGFIDFMFKGKSLMDFKNLFLTDNFEKYGEVILNYFLK